MAGRRYTILIVDDEPDVLESLRLSLELDYEVLTAPGGEAALGLIAEREVALIISDQRMPGLNGVQFLEKAQEISPNSVRMMLTGFSDFDAIVEAINRGQIYRYIHKPWEPRDLEVDVRRAVEVYEMKANLGRRMDELCMLCDIGASIASLADTDAMIQKILDAVVGTLGFDRAFLMLVDAAANRLRTRGYAGIREEARAFISQLEYDMAHDDVAVVLTVTEGRSLLVEDVDDAPISVDRKAAHHIGIRSFVTAPLRVGDRRIGVLVADRSRAGERVTEHDRRLLSGFADQAAIAIENARLYGEALAKKALDEEVGVAARIQQHLLPQTLPELPGFQLAALSRPSRVVSGDYYDVVSDGKNRVWVAQGEVSGKGIPAAMTRATLRTLFRAELERVAGADLCEAALVAAMGRIGEGLWRCTAPEVFATFCFGVLDMAARTFTCVNAGHPLPLLMRRNGQMHMIEGAGLPVGMDPAFARQMPYRAQQVALEAGDVLVLCSDGVTEAGAVREDMFGDERLAQVVAAHRHEGARAVQEAICRAVDAFLDDAPADDDLTLMVISVEG